ncbi:MAG: hypothetical protein DIZ80_03460 [endosymbiont of Galathealinum brachiosum]|uniref:Uncharacterized protein n=1 Tax=endosymbiont of Galathealinum brachiosum TaxID=2200906 RepID=A0A370DI31_9GAMM|nr:MAG: hypothetical protein DIZ80_03460 [endosymbiont of Galathealinum brachiosum]
MQNKFVSIQDEQPENNQSVIAYKLKVVLGEPIFTNQNCVQTFYIDGDFFCGFKPTHWAEMPALKIE